MSQNLTDDEVRAIASLKRLAKRWPKSLWLFSASGTLHVMRKVDGAPVYRMSRNTVGAPIEGVDQAYSVATVDIENDGGDW